MAYVPKAAKDRALWITPKEAVAHVCGIERCKPKEAERQIRHALADTKLLLRWADAKPIGYYKSGRAKFGMDQPPKEPNAIQNEDHDWLKVKIDWDSGKTHDPQAHFFNKLRRMDAASKGKAPRLWDNERPLLLLKKSIEKEWPTPDTVTNTRPAHHTGAPGRPTPWHYYESEVTRRWKAGGLGDAKLSDLADSLMAWQKTLSAPKFPPLKKKTLMNKCRLLFRELKEQRSAE